MLVEQRTYQLRPGTTHEFLKAYEAEGLALRRVFPCVYSECLNVI